MKSSFSQNPKNEQYQGIVKTKFDSKTNENSPSLPGRIIGNKIHSITS